jgi:hypothetical protein
LGFEYNDKFVRSPEVFQRDYLKFRFLWEELEESNSIGFKSYYPVKEEL